MYTGIAQNVQLRFELHCSGKGARFTRAFPPDSILVQWPCINQRVALQLEYAIKQLCATKKRALAAGELVTLSRPLQQQEDGVWYDATNLLDCLA